MNTENLKRKPGLKRKAIETLAVICALSKQKGYCYATKKDMAKWLHLSETDLYKQLNELKNMDLIYASEDCNHKIFVDHEMITKFCMSLSQIDDKHLYLTIPYCFFALGKAEQDDYKKFKEEEKNREEESKTKKEKEKKEIPEWVKELLQEKLQEKGIELEL